MTTTLEQTRAAHEAVAEIQKTLSSLLRERDTAKSNAKATCTAEHCLAWLVSETQQQAQRAVELQEDADGLLAEELDLKNIRIKTEGHRD